MRGERRLIWFENVGRRVQGFSERPIEIHGPHMGGFKRAYAVLNGGRRLNIVGASGEGLGWVEQPSDPGAAWRWHSIGALGPDGRARLSR